MGLSKEEILRKLIERHGSQDHKILKEAAYNLAIASTTESNLSERAERTLRLLKSSGPAPKPLTKSAQKQEGAFLSTCPICKCKMRSVKLIEDRDAFYCPDHRIINPFPSITEDEADV